MSTFRKTQAQASAIVESLWTRKEMILDAFADASAYGFSPPSRESRDTLAQINRDLDSYGAPRSNPNLY
jgi:hypothetical protein